MRKLLFTGTPIIAPLLIASNALWAQEQQSIPTSQQQLIEEVNQLRTEVKELHTQLDAQQIALRQATQTRADEEDVRRTTELVMADAEKRSEMMTSQLTSGYFPDRGAIIQSQDGNYLLHPWAFIQVRGTANYREKTTDGGSDSEAGFELPRVKFILDGNAISPDTTYQLIWATNDTTGNLGLQDAWVRHHFVNSEFALRGGQIRNPLDHEQIMYATKNMTPDRSMVNNILLNGDDIVKGVSLEYGYDDTKTPFRAAAAITSGQRNFDTTFQTFPTNSANWGASARVEWKLMGNWKDYAQFTSLNNKEQLLVLGIGADYTEAGDTFTLTHVVDAQYNLPNGLSLYGAYLGRYTQNNGDLPNTNGGKTGPGNFPDTYDATLRLMAAYVIDQRWEPFIRYEYIGFDGDDFAVAVPNHVVHDITAGFNYYLYGHRAKFSTGLSYLPNGSPIGSTLGDVLISGDGSEWIFQTQFQLVL